MSASTSTIGAPVSSGRPSSGAAAPTPAPRPVPWALGGAAAVALLVLAGWLLVLAPQAAATQDLRDQTAQTESNEALLTARTAQLEQQFAGLPEHQAQLAELQRELPADAALPALVRSVRAAALASGVELTGLVPSAPAALGGATAAADPVTTADATTAEAPVALPGTTTTGTTTTGPAAPSAGTAGAGTLLEVPLSITATGGYAALEAFLSALQQQDRLLLVGSTSFTPGGAAVDGGPTPLQLTVTGSVFVLPTADPAS